MMPQSAANRPLDRAMKERLHLQGDNPFIIKFIRGLIHTSDALSRTLFGRPFLALRESEACLEQLDGLKGQALIEALLKLNGGTTINPQGLQHIPQTGPVIIASTHPTGMFDFIAHAPLFKKRPDLKVVANREAEKFLGPDSIIPVTISKQNRAMSGSQTRQEMLEHLQSDGALLIFGSGRVPDCHKGKLVEPPWRSGASQASEAGHAPIIPAALNAMNSSTYYRTRAFARLVSGRNDHFGAMIASLRYFAEVLEKLGGQHDVMYGPLLPPGTDPITLKQSAETLVPNLYNN